MLLSVVTNWLSSPGRVLSRATPRPSLWPLLSAEAARASYQTAVKQWKDSWKKLAENPQTKGSLAAACKISDRLRGKRVALIMSGGNVTLAGLKELLA